MRRVILALGLALLLSGAVAWKARTSIMELSESSAAAPHFLAMVQHGAELAHHLVNVAPALTEATVSEGDGSSRLVRLTRALDESRGELAAAQRELDALRGERSQIHAEGLPRLSGSFQFLDRLLPAAADALQLAQFLPKALGTHGVRRYLLVFQNVDELRATGGHISSAGVATLEDGRITALSFGDSASLTNFSTPHPAPPEPMRRYMGEGIWITRTANWSPDFPTAARAMEALYLADQQVATDGVIAVDQSAVARLTDLVGGVEVEDYGVHVTGQNLLAYAEQFYGNPRGTENGGTAARFAHRKDFMGDVLRAFVRQVQTTPLDASAWTHELPALAREGHLFVYLNESAGEALLHGYELDGAMRAVHGEYLQWVDWNMGYNKVDARVQRQLSVRVQLAAHEPSQFAASMTYINTNAAEPAGCIRPKLYDIEYAKLQEGCSWNYARLYVTRGAQFLSATGGQAPELQPPEGEPHFPGFGSFLIVSRGTSRSLTFKYLGSVMDGQTFQLYVQKQAGLVSLPISLEIEYPSAWKVEQSSPSATAGNDGTITFNRMLVEGQEFTIQFAPVE